MFEGGREGERGVVLWSAYGSTSDLSQRFHLLWVILYTRPMFYFFLRYDKLHNLFLCEIACFQCLISDGQNTSIFINILISYNVRGRCIFKSCQLHTLHMINCLKCTGICRSTWPSKIYYGSGLPVSVLCSFFLVILENCMCIPGTTTKLFFG